MVNKDTNTPLSGMSNSHPSQLKDSQYLLLQNGNIQDWINGAPIITNEPSNILCLQSKFVLGFKVIGQVYVPELDITYLFWVNPETNQSEVGYLNQYKFTDFNDFPVVNSCSECSNLNKEDIPLELRNQLETCTYNTLTTVNCLNFSIDNPIFIPVVKKDDCGITIYFTDNLNPLRFIHIDRVSGLVDNMDLSDTNCNGLKIFPDANRPCTIAQEVSSGGTLLGGTVQIAVAYALSNGRNRSHYFTVSMPLPIWSKQHITDPVLNYVTDKSVTYTLSGLDTQDFDYINIALISTINGTTDVKLKGTFAITSLEDGVFTYHLTNNEGIQDLSINDIFQRNPIYDTAGTLTTANNLLIWGDLTAPPELNMQPITNKIKLHWITVEAEEGSYQDSIFASEYRTFQRDEVYTFGLVYGFTDTRESCSFHIPGIAIEDVITPSGVQLCSTTVNNYDNPQYPSGLIPCCTPTSISCAYPCQTDLTFPCRQNYYWQVYNTATNLGIPLCAVTPSSSTSITPVPAPPLIIYQAATTICELVYTIDYTKIVCGSSIDLPNPVTYNGGCTSCIQNYIDNNPGAVFVSQEVSNWSLGTEILCTEGGFAGSDVFVPFTYTATCTLTFNVPIVNSTLSTPPSLTPVLQCGVSAYEYGDFAYWQSQVCYPDNSTIWGELAGKPIRHHKFPDSCITHIHDSISHPSDTGQTSYYTSTLPKIFQTKNKIYPIGVKIDTEYIVPGGILPNGQPDGSVKGAITWGIQQGIITQVQANTISTFRVTRGNRVGNKSVVAKGMVFDMLNYQNLPFPDTDPVNTVYFPNYPYNDLGLDQYINQTNDGTNFVPLIPNKNNTRYTFHSPDTSFNDPSLGDYVKLETVEYGVSRGWFTSVKGASGYQLPTTITSELAIGLAISESQLDLLSSLFTSDATLIGLAESIVKLFTAAQNVYPLYSQWVDIIKGLERPRNLTKYYVSDSNYNSFCCVPNTGYKIRNLENSAYLKPQILQLSENGSSIKINNWERESSVYLKVPDQYQFLTPSAICNVVRDNSKFLLSNNLDGLGCSITTSTQTSPGNVNYQESPARYRNLVSYYTSIKNTIPSQYNQIGDIDYLDTGFCGSIQWVDNSPTPSACQIIFGGDTFINKFEFKRKHPFFIQNNVGYNLNDDIQYSFLGNAGSPQYYFNTINNNQGANNLDAILSFIPGIIGIIVDGTTIAINNPLATKDYTLDCDIYSKYVLDGTIYLFSYGIPSFFVESDINLDLRYAKNEYPDNFPSNVGDIKDWTQEIKVPIATDNSYNYNRDYSKQNIENVYCIQRLDYDPLKAECRVTYPNRVISSLPDDDNTDLTDNWLVYLANDYHDFPLTNGNLISIHGTEREKVVLNFEKTVLVYNAYYTMQLSEATIQVGTGAMFSQKPLEYAKSDIGFGGTENKAFISTKYGHFWVDTKRGSVFQLPPESGGSYSPPSPLKEISQSLKPFFSNNLPFYILKDFPTYPTDNNYKDIGFTIGLDNRFERVFFTKLDYELRSQWKNFNPQYGISSITGLPTLTIDITDSQGLVRVTPISLTDTTYFCNKSWTIAYSPLTDTWISYYSFIPNFYISYENYFQTGINYPQDLDNSKLGIWNHLITNKSYQVYYGQLYPYINDVVVKEQLINKQLQSIEYQADFLRFQNDYDYYYNPKVTFNKMVIWSENQNTGNLTLVPRVNNDLSQDILYPIINTDSTTILVTRKTHNWRVNQFFDIVDNKGNDIPPMIYNCSPYLKEPNPLAINYFKSTWQRSHLTSDYFTLRFINDIYSNYLIYNKFMTTEFIKSYT